MNINIIISGAAYTSQIGYTAIRFVEAALLAGHSVSQVFFYRDGVGQSSALMVPSADEFNPAEAWSQLAKTQEIKLAVCVSAAERRGILNTSQQAEFGKMASNLHPDFEVVGLGEMHDASLLADRTVTFK